MKGLMRHEWRKLTEYVHTHLTQPSLHWLIKREQETQSSGHGWSSSLLLHLQVTVSWSTYLSQSWPWSFTATSGTKNIKLGHLWHRWHFCITVNSFCSSNWSPVTGKRPSDFLPSFFASEACSGIEQLNEINTDILTVLILSSFIFIVYNIVV